MLKQPFHMQLQQEISLTCSTAPWAERPLWNEPQWKTSESRSRSLYNICSFLTFFFPVLSTDFQEPHFERAFPSNTQVPTH